ncbi:MAG: hypothetical protein V4515_12330 [Chloroflexota bacterium]
MPTVPRFDLPKGIPANRPVVPLVLRGERRGVSSVLAALRLRGDAQDRLRLGLDASGRPRIEFGNSGAPDLALRREAGPKLMLDGNDAGAANAPWLEIVVPTAHASGYDAVTLLNSGDTNPRISFGKDNSGFPTFKMGAGGVSSSDVTLSRPAAKTLALKAGAGTDLLLRFGGTSFPASPADGDLFYRTDLYDLYRYNSTLAQWVTRPAITAYHSTTQSFTAATETALACNSDDGTDPWAMHDTATNNSRIVVPIAGRYAIRAFAYWGNTWLQSELLRFRKNGTTFIRGTNVYTVAPSAGSGAPSMESSVVAVLAANDYVEAMLTLGTNSTVGHASAAEAQTVFSVHYIGPA